MSDKIDGVIEKHYWRAVVFLIVVILIGSAFWGVRRFHPALFLGTPDLIAVPNDLATKKKPSLTENRPVLLNINVASAKELQSLPSIGETMALRIVEYREKHGKFSSVEKLTEVKGIGEKTLEKLKPFISVTDYSEL